MKNIRLDDKEVEMTKAAVDSAKDLLDGYIVAGINGDLHGNILPADSNSTENIIDKIRTLEGIQEKLK